EANGEIGSSTVTNKDVFIPKGNYRVGEAIEIPSGQKGRINLYGEPGSVLSAFENDITILHFLHDITRTGPRTVCDLRLQGRRTQGVTGVTGIKVGSEGFAVLQLVGRNLHVRTCDIGIDLENAQEQYWENCTLYQNVIGLKIRQADTGGGGGNN